MSTPIRQNITADNPVLKVTVYLKSGAQLSFPGRVDKIHGAMAVRTVAPLEIPFVDFDAVALIIQEPWTEES